MPVQWVRTHLPVQETWARSLVSENPTCLGAAKFTHHSYSARTLEPGNRSPYSLQAERASVQQQRPSVVMS